MCVYWLSYRVLKSITMKRLNTIHHLKWNFMYNSFNKCMSSVYFIHAFVSYLFLYLLYLCYPFFVYLLYHNYCNKLFIVIFNLWERQINTLYILIFINYWYIFVNLLFLIKILINDDIYIHFSIYLAKNEMRCPHNALLKYYALDHMLEYIYQTCIVCLRRIINRRKEFLNTIYFSFS